MIPVGDAVWLLVVIGLALFAVGWAGRALYDREKTGDVWLAGYDKAAEDWKFHGPEREAAAEREHEAAWAAEFSEPDLGDFVTGVLDDQAARDAVPDDQLAPPCANCGSRIRHACFDGCPGRVGPELDELLPEPELPELEGDILTPHQERAPTIAELADHADYTITWTELDRLRVSAYAWYDEAFGTGQFRAVGR